MHGVYRSCHADCMRTMQAAGLRLGVNSQRSETLEGSKEPHITGHNRSLGRLDGQTDQEHGGARVHPPRVSAITDRSTDRPTDMVR